MTSTHPDAIAYHLDVEQLDGHPRFGGLLTTPRRFRAGDRVNLPKPGPHDAGPPGGRGYVWRITAVDDVEPSLRIAYIGPRE